MAFKVGQKVVCIEGFFDGNLPDTPEGEVYTIARIEPVYCFGARLDRDGLIFEGTPLIPSSHGPAYDCYKAARFRPLVETNIDIFQAMLANPHREVEVVE